MQVKTEAQTGLTGEIKIVPLWAWILAAVVFVGAQVAFNMLFAGLDDPKAWVRVPMGFLAGTILGGYLLLIGYVSRDARRRGMSSLLWTLVAILIPNGLGIILYFILRQPLHKTCPQCGNSVQTGFNFCPRCSRVLSPSCPQCQRVVGGNDVYCPYCGTSLRDPAK
jgi:RNA polymerase subunit RPABC4/transcription elongation factor Spt4